MLKRAINYGIAIHKFKGSPALCAGIFHRLQRLREEITIMIKKSKIKIMIRP